ncbi:MAG: sigma 54-interacting transcriptional regulator, partial [Bacillota bacterium]|nr:sigma 54-interacting transcriptional regulator [Bacillota bacterium]
MKGSSYKNIMEQVLALLEEGVHVVDARGNSIIYNEAMSRLEKTESRDVLGKPFRQVFSGIAPEDSTLLAALERGESTTARQQTYQNKNGRLITTINSTAPVREGDRIIGAVEIARNITDLQELSDKLLDIQSQGRSPALRQEGQIKKYNFANLVGEDPVFLRRIDAAKKAAGSDASVFIYGETGTGKELIAQSIHFHGQRKEKPFLAQNCAALPESLLEGILFGTEKGGFTGAVDREGLFEQAHGGTLLLDEVSAMPLALQGKLLRVLQEECLRRVGGTRDIAVDVRIIATANEPPAELMARGALRKDLYYRLNVLHISLPPLRERRQDVLLLAEYFLDKYNRKSGKDIWMLSEGAKERLLAHDYPGNVRELENIMRRGVAMVTEEHVLTAEHLSMEEEGTAAGGDYEKARRQGLEAYLDGVERALIEAAMKESRGNISRAAAALGIKRQTLQHKL